MKINNLNLQPKALGGPNSRTMLPFIGYVLKVNDASLYRNYGVGVQPQQCGLMQHVKDAFPYIGSIMKVCDHNNVV